MKEQSRTKMLAHDIPLRAVKLLNVILMTIPFAWCWYGYYVGQMENSFYKKGNLLMLVLFMLVYFMFARVYSAFLVSVNRISEMVYSQVLAVLITDGITYLVIVLLVKGFPSVIPGLLAIAGQIVISFVWCTLAHLWYFHTFPPQKTMIVYDVREGMEKLISQYDMQKKFKVEEVLQVEECLNDMKKLDEMETVFLSGIHSRERNIILKYCIDRHVRVYVIPRVGDVLMSNTLRVLKQYPVKQLVLAGGVAANQGLRERLQQDLPAAFPDTELILAPLKLCGDNGAMIGAAGYVQYQHHQFGDATLNADPSLEFDWMPGMLK